MLSPISLFVSALRAELSCPISVSCALQAEASSPSAHTTNRRILFSGFFANKRETVIVSEDESDPSRMKRNGAE